VTFAWSGDTAGQGWSINREWGGMKCYETVRRDRPDFFVHCGDTIYADGPIMAEVPLPGDQLWKNVVTEEVSKVAETLKEFRGRYAYNLMDDNARRMAAEVLQVWQWDDHEVTNNWSDAKDLSADKRYTDKNVQLLIGRATRAFLEYAPLRYRGADESERVYRKISYGPLLDVFVNRHAQLPRPELLQPAGAPRPGDRVPRRAAACVAEERTGEVEGAVEGRVGRHADRAPRR